MLIRAIGLPFGANAWPRQKARRKCAKSADFMLESAKGTQNSPVYKARCVLDVVLSLQRAP
eukprot:1923146-Pleurochrysis_carterae.AAC.1